MVIYTDGSYTSSSNTGGIAFIILSDDNKIIATFSKKYLNTTNQRMEQLAVAVALESVKKPNDITIITDSAYVVNTYTKNWKRKCNNDLWDRIDKAMVIHNVTFQHVRGHQGNEYNELCDQLATQINK